ncbi:hypothetical protein ABB02_00502 [Clostridiaceae bacterium JG1575]|nr:hypothetical protein ABB02_00502 [Clostridiaceae bacterium JG1575]
MYVAIIGDMVDSRHLQERAKVQEQLRGILQKLNESLGEKLASQFTLTLGDEFQGLFHSAEGVFPALWQLKFQMHPVKIRFGVGLGRMDTAIDPKRSLGSDGPAYHEARRRIEEVKKGEGGKYLLHRDVLVGAADCAQSLRALNAGLTLLHGMECRWTSTQWQNVSDGLLKGLNQSQIAKMRGIHQSSVQRSFAAAGFYEYQEGYWAMAALFEQIWAKCS